MELPVEEKPPPSTTMGKVWAEVQRWQIRMELVILAISICDTARVVITPTLMLKKVKRAYNASEYEPDPDLYEKWYNKQMVVWDQNYTYVNMPLAIAATIFFGAYSDRRGRKVPMILGLLGMLFGNLFYLLVWWPTTDWALQWIFLAGVLNGVTGGFRMVTGSVNAYLSDQFKVKKTLSFRMIITYTILNVGDLIGSQMTKFISRQWNEIVAAFIMQAINLIVICYVIFIVKPVGERDDSKQSIVTIGKDALRSVWLSAKVVIRPRENGCRALLLLTFFCALVNRVAFSEEKALIGTYTKLKPFEWTTSDFAQYKSYRPFTQILGLIFGLVVLKKLLKLRDTTILILATISMGLDSLLIGLATSSLLIYLSMIAGFLHALTNPLLYTLYSCLVEPNETGRVYAMDSILHNIGYFIKTAVLQNVYIHTVNWYQGFIWLLLSSMAVVSASVLTVIHFVSKRRGVGED
ncbi:unnamed protein product [Bursaphelenchus xylophilus]|uniref:(pine wood nematode) hypothetical protein n=1 Tax=Bursaphelenchus xylophilus TaxID=6326 RepID=A0A1I7SMC8_BURXY|nr:unnamed protein product [Bursaphelenchus xylophilus]CAG9130118.1 unnamed protein product [Bursaphelenchus xylophilus]